MQKKIKIGIIDDHPLIVEGLKKLLSDSNFFDEIYSFNDSSEILEQDILKSLNIILLDVFLKNENGIDICAQIRKINSKIVVLGISSQAERTIILQMLKNGANGYLLKSAKLNEYLTCIKEAISGKITFCDEVREIMSKPDFLDYKSIPRLTRREKEIIKLLAEGKSTIEISEALFLSPLTIQTHRRNLLNKFDVKNSTELLNFVKEHGLM